MPGLGHLFHEKDSELILSRTEFSSLQISADLLSNSFNWRNKSSSMMDRLPSQVPVVWAGASAWSGVHFDFSETKVKYSDFVVDKLINRIFGLFAQILSLKRGSSQAGGVFTFRFEPDAK